MKKAGQKTVAVSLRFMNVKSFIFSAVLFLFTTTGWTAPQPYPQSYGRPSRSSSGEDLTSILRQLKDGLANLKHEIRTHESEIRIFENKLQSQESTLEDLQQRLTEDLQSQQDFAKASHANLEGKTEALDQSIRNLETVVKGLTADLRQMKTQANDSVTILGQYKEKISELENFLHTQNQHMQNVEAALQSMMEVWQAKEAAREIANKTSEGIKTYKVQAGDSLEKIARLHKISVQALREINQLSNDRIIIGQTLKIPSS